MLITKEQEFLLENKKTDRHIPRVLVNAFQPKHKSKLLSSYNNEPLADQKSVLTRFRQQ